MTETVPVAEAVPVTVAEPTRSSAIEIRGLTARTPDRVLVTGVDLDIPEGAVTAIIGGSGSGKTTTALALMGEHRPGVTLSMDRRDAAGVRFGYVPQHPSSVLGPALRIGTVLRDIERAAHRVGHQVSVPDALQRAGFPNDPAMLRRYPHQLSGGQQQRLVIAQTLLTNPTCLIMDEPTTGQDPANRAAVLHEIIRLAGQNLTVVLLTHDLDAVEQVAQHVIVMAHGQVTETGDTGMLQATTQPQTRALIAAYSRTGRHGSTDRTTARTTAPTNTRVTMDGVTAGFRNTAVLQNFSLSMKPGECVALVGPSGCGKTTAARVLAGLHPQTAGRVLLDGRPLAGTTWRRTREQAAAIAYVFQDAKAAFDPYRTVWEQILRGPVRLRGATDREAAAAVRTALEQVGLDEQITRERPSALSGGEAQRAALARALAAAPSVLICDEVTSGLDPVTQLRVLDILTNLTRAHDLSLLVISHDAAVVGTLADDVVDMNRRGSRGK
ncbi:Oligopeptide transport ATP-binding protein OppF [Rhodococcus wratislaviensis]|uniref:Oligopeptide transport ATP-binding protein OppF n=1 Tax=Rhodococcus wratislaviensis TaxID=44752 RepID=A0A402C2Z0_RHOWR|nr:ATP-binding cassette domain-containing protein [Rhodococcus wratislaviensis]GCE37949.1 Oligopeptide transport ATP-binding protein OppF [Rhodococcus wratislaviensis]